MIPVRANAGDADLVAPLAHLAEHGWARLGRVLTDEQLAPLRERADDLMLGRVTYPGLFFQHDSATGRYEDLEYGAGWKGPSLSYRKLEKLELDPVFRALIECPLHERIARALIGDAVTLYRAVLMIKGAAGGSPLPWHQDGGHFWGVSIPPTLQIWTGLDDAPQAAGCLEFVSGTHRLGLATPTGGVVPQNHLEREHADARAVPVPTVAGEALLIHNHVWHRSGANTTGRPRRALSICLMDAATRCLRKKRAPRQFVRLFVRRAAA